jgi:uncharacterized protein YqeY
MLIDDVQRAMYEAMKARRGEEASALRLALSALKSAAIDARADPARGARHQDHGIPEGDQAEDQGGARLWLSNEQAVAVLQREARKRREAEQAYRDAGRPEQADKEAFERSVLDRFLPARLDPAELTRLVDEAVAATGASGPRELGKVMGRVMPQVRGRADGDEVRRLALERLQAAG